MRFLLAVLAAMLLATTAGAQTAPTEYGFEGDSHARIAFGDVPLTAPTEAAGTWHLVEYVRFNHDGNSSTVMFPAHGEREAVDCTCGNFTVSGQQVNVGNDVAAGDYVVRVTASLGNGAFFVSNVQSSIVAYVPDDQHVETDATGGTTGLRCTSGTCDIHEYGAANYFGIFPGAADTGGNGAIPTPTEDGFDVLPWIAGILIGALLWAFLVKQGYVQKRRKQEVVKAAHVEAAEAESKETLEARKRVLMSGLKELEKAKMAKEIDSDVYDALKAELKKETVTVMRALEAAE